MRYFGKIGFERTEKTGVDVYTENIVERDYYGDVNRNYRRTQTSDSVNDDIQLTNQISIVADPFAIDNFASIRYATYLGSKWNVTSVEVQFPRLVLTLGGVYNAH